MPKTATIRRQAGKWFVCIVCEVLSEPLPPSDEALGDKALGDEALGLGAGLDSFLVLSNGEFVEIRASSARTNRLLPKQDASKPRPRSVFRQGARPTRFCLVSMSVSETTAMILFTKLPAGWSIALASEPLKS